MPGYVGRDPCRSPWRRLSCRKSRNESHCPLNRTIQGVVLVTGALLSAVASAQSLQAMTVSGPAEVVGDGVTPIQVQVTLDHHSPGELEGLKVDVSAGRIAGQKELADGSLEVTIIPPRVVESGVMVVEMQSRHGQRQPDHHLRFER